MQFKRILKPKRGFRNRIRFKRKPYKLIFILPLPLVIILFFSVFKTGFLEIKKVEIESTGVNCATPDQLIAESAIEGQNFLLLNGEGINQKIKKKFICVRQVLVDVYFLSKVKIKVLSRNPVFILSITEEDKSQKIPLVVNTSATVSATLNFSNIKVERSFLLDDEGIIFAEKNNMSLPILYTDQSLNLGQTVEKEKIKNTIKIFERVKEFGLNLNDAKIYSSSELITNTEPKLIFDLSGDVNVQLASLQLILGEAKISDSKMEFIDLRFDKPVVKYLPKEKGEK